MKRLFIAALAAVLLVAFGCGAKSDKSDKSADGPTAFDVANNYIVNLMTQSMMNDGDSIPLLKAVEIEAWMHPHLREWRKSYTMARELSYSDFCTVSTTQLML